MSLLQKDHLDLQQGGDTGQANTDAIQPIVDGEGASQTTFRRPSENLRGRTEEIRELAQDLIYYRDNNHMVIEGATGHTVTWPGVSTGIIVQSGDLTIRPLLTPPSSTKGSMDIGTNGVDRVTYAASSTAYATMGLNAVTIEHRDGGVSATHACTITDGPVKRILVVFDDADTSHDSAATKVLVDAAVALDSDLVGYLDVTDNGAGGTSIEIQAETALEGTADQEAHLISSGLLDTLTTTTPLVEGAAIGIWYPYVVEPIPTTPTFGGRQESNPDRTTHVIPIGSLFVTSADPQKIPGAVPLCKVVNDELVFFDGTRLRAGATGPMGTAGSVFIDATTFAGAKTNVSNGGIDNPLSPATAQEAFGVVDDRLGQLRAFSYVCTDGTASTGGDYDGSTALQLAVTQLAGTGGSIYLRRGTYAVPASYTYGANIRIVGEHASLVILQPDSFSSQNPAAGMRFEGVTFGTNLSALTIATPQHDVQFKNCTAVGTSATTVSVTADRALFDSVTWSVDHDVLDVTPFAISGDDNSFLNCSLSGGITASGDRNRFSGCDMRHIGDALAVVASGIGNVFLDLRVDKTAGDTGAAGALITLPGADTYVDGMRVTTTGSALATVDSVMRMASASGTQTFKRIHILAGNHMALEYAASANNEASFTGCSFINASTTVDTFATTGVIGVRVSASFENCVFDDGGQEGNSVANLAYLADLNAHSWRFTDCVFRSATFDNTPCGHFRHASFTGCKFVMQNNAYMPSLDQGAVDGFWRFEGVMGQTAGADNGRCLVRDCTFDFSDKELVNAGAGDAQFMGAYVEITQGDIINPRFVGLNRHGLRQLGEGSVLRLNTGARMDDGSFTWTATADVQGGAGPSDDGWIAVNGNDVTVENLKYVEVVAGSYAHTLSFLRVDPTTTARFTLRNCTFSESSAPMQHGFSVTSPTGTGHSAWNWDNVQFGDVISGSNGMTTEFFPLTCGGSSIIRGCRFYFDVATHTLGLILFGQAVGGGKNIFCDNRIQNSTSSTGSDPVFSVTGFDHGDTAFNGNVIYTIDAADGATLRPLFNGVPSVGTNAVAVGNVFLNIGGTTEDGSISIVTPNVGLP